MKFHPKTRLLLLLTVLLIISCKKKPKPADPVITTPVVCNLSHATLVQNDTVLSIIADTAYATMNNTFYSEHMIDTGQGCSVEFEGNTSAPEGTYAITPVFGEVTAGSKKTYVQYFEAGKVFIAQAGNVKITGSGTSATLEFCKIYFKDSFGEEKTISIKTDAE